jgi:hypothetical protein
MPLTIESIEVGVLERKTVPAVRISRKDFLGVVESVFEHGFYDPEQGRYVEYPDSVRDKLMPVAETIAVFPFGNWVAPERGCGCVVGEYLVAADIIDREDAASQTGRLRQNDVEALLREQEDGKALVEFGVAIDEGVQKHLGVKWFDDDRPYVAVIED